MSSVESKKAETLKRGWETAEPFGNSSIKESDIKCRKTNLAVAKLVAFNGKNEETDRASPRQYINLKATETSVDRGPLLLLAALVQRNDSSTSEVGGLPVYWSVSAEPATQPFGIETGKDTYALKAKSKTNDRGWTPIVRILCPSSGGASVTVRATLDENFSGGREQTYEVWRKVHYGIHRMKTADGQDIYGTLFDEQTFATTLQSHFITLERVGEPGTCDYRNIVVTSNAEGDWGKSLQSYTGSDPYLHFLFSKDVSIESKTWTETRWNDVYELETEFTFDPLPIAEELTKISYRIGGTGRFQQLEDEDDAEIVEGQLQVRLDRDGTAATRLRTALQTQAQENRKEKKAYEKRKKSKAKTPKDDPFAFDEDDFPPELKTGVRIEFKAAMKGWAPLAGACFRRVGLLVMASRGYKEPALQSTTLHEFLHGIGLVFQKLAGKSNQYHDSLHPSHCTRRKKCCMYWRGVDTTTLCDSCTEQVLRGPVTVTKVGSLQ